MNKKSNACIHYKNLKISVIYFLTVYIFYIQYKNKTFYNISNRM
jgi:hypothetical protein